MTENQLERVIKNIREVTKEVYSLNQRLRGYLNLSENRINILNKKHQVLKTNDEKTNNSISNYINLEDEYNIFDQVDNVKKDCVNSLETQALDEMKHKYEGYKEQLKFGLDHNQYDKIDQNQDKLYIQDELGGSYLTLNDEYTYMIDQSYYLFHDEVNNMIFLLDQFINYNKTLKKVTNQLTPNIDLGRDVFFTYRKIEELLPRLRLLNQEVITESSIRQKRQLDSMMNLMETIS